MAGIRKGFSPLIEAEKFLPQGQTSQSSPTFLSGKRLGNQAYTKPGLKPDWGKTWTSCCILHQGTCSVVEGRRLQPAVAAGCGDSGTREPQLCCALCWGCCAAGGSDAAPKHQYGEQPRHCQAMPPAAEHLQTHPSSLRGLVLWCRTNSISIKVNFQGVRKGHEGLRQLGGAGSSRQPGFLIQGQVELSISSVCFHHQ